jgi:LPS sulfotransferase NodH
VTDELDIPDRCYLICTVQPTGSWLLSHALHDTGVAGIPAETPSCSRMTDLPSRDPEALELLSIAA